MDHLVHIGFDPRYGGRPFQRAFEQQVVTPLAERMVSESALSRATLEIDLEGDQIRMTVVAN